MLSGHCTQLTFHPIRLIFSFIQELKNASYAKRCIEYFEMSKYKIHSRNIYHLIYYRKKTVDKSIIKTAVWIRCAELLSKHGYWACRSIVQPGVLVWPCRPPVLLNIMGIFFYHNYFQILVNFFRASPGFA
jgi:hypothetical protein